MASAQSGASREAARAVPRSQPTDRENALARSRALARQGLLDQAIAAYEAWIAGHPNDLEAWRELAHVRQRAGRLHGSRAALTRALELAPADTALRNRREALEARAAPAVEIGMIGTGETGASSFDTRVTADVQSGDASRLGVIYQHRRLDSDGLAVQSGRLRMMGAFRPRAHLQVNVSGGAAWMQSALVDPGRPWHPEFTFRLRRRGQIDETTIDLRAAHSLLDINLDALQADLSMTQGTASVEVPLEGRWRLRGRSRLGWLRSRHDHNLRTEYGGGPAFAVRPDVNLAGQWLQLRHRQPTMSGYFAPRLADQVVVTVDLDKEFGSFAIGLDAGGGWQRFQEHDMPMGEWGPAARLWALATWTLRPGRQVLVEVESYNSPVSSLSAVAAGERWRYLSIAASLRLAVR